MLLTAAMRLLCPVTRVGVRLHAPFPTPLVPPRPQDPLIEEHQQDLRRIMSEVEKRERAVRELQQQSAQLELRVRGGGDCGCD
jgi:hypothetical protein